MNSRLIGLLAVLTSVLLLPAAFGQTATHTGPMNVVGRVEAHRGGYYTVYPASYTLREGFLTPQSLLVRLARFEQIGGTNRVAGDLQVVQGWYNDYTVYRLSGGRLVTSNSIINTFAYYPGVRGFVHSDGTHVVRGKLNLQGSFRPYPGGYSFSGGELIVRDIEVGSGAIFWQGGGKLTHGGKMTLAAGHWQLGTPAPRSQRLGRLQLNAAQADSSFTFSKGTLAIVRFAPSAEIPWDPDARLIIQHWQGRMMGRGLHQI